MASIERRATSLMDLAFQKNDDSLRFANWENTDLQGETLVRDCVKSLILGWSIFAHIANLRTDTQIYSEDTMTEMKRTTDDEIDLIELFEILWNGKLFILTVTILATVVGFAYAQFTKPVYVPNYKITVPYVYTLVPIGSSNKAKMNFIIDPSWAMTDTQFEQSAHKPKDPVTYTSALNKVNDVLTNEVLIEAQAELAFMKTAMNEMVQLASSETFMSNFLNVRRLIFNIENGAKVIRFGDLSINEIKPQPSKDNLKIALAFVLGLFASIAWVLLRHALVQRRKV